MAIALSGGGDSVALLLLAADWARVRGRRLLALTVDHGLSPGSPAWSRFAAQTARAAGADWRGLCWRGPKPPTGLPAAARRARHALIAGAAREAGARVILFAHTADDVAEAAVMRAEGSTVRAPAEWTPSPAWPEGRGLVLFRPLLEERRAALRAWLGERGARWIDDPANDDLRYARARARQSLSPLPWGDGLGRAGRSDASGRKGEGPPCPVAQGRLPAPLPFAEDRSPAAPGRSSPLPPGEGWFSLDRSAPAAALAAALVCAGGGDRLPSRAALETLRRRLHEGESFAAALAGARLDARDERVLVTREPGEFRRRPRPPLALLPDEPTVWDGRWEIVVDAGGWLAVPAAGRLARLDPGDRAGLAALPPAARAALPVLIRDDDPRPRLAWEVARTNSLVEERLALALGERPHEAVLAPHGEPPRKHLSFMTTSYDRTGVPAGHRGSE